MEKRKNATKEPFVATLNKSLPSNTTATSKPSTGEVTSAATSGGSIKYFVLLTFFCVFVTLAIKFVQVSNLLAPIIPHHYEDCRVVKGPIGAEDIILDRRGVLLISSDARDWLPKVGREGLFLGPNEARERMKRQREEGTATGAIWAYDSRTKETSDTAGKMVKLEIELEDGLTLIDFNPHGIVVPAPIIEPGKTEADYPVFLYVLNHAAAGDEVDVFEVKYTKVAKTNSTTTAGGKSEFLFPPKLHLISIVKSSAYFKTLNEVEAFYPTRSADGTQLIHTIFAGNYLSTALGDGLWNMIELVFQRPWGSIVACQTAGRGGESATTCVTAVEGLNAPNGLAITPDRQALYVALTMTGEVQSYLLPLAVWTTFRSFKYTPSIDQFKGLQHLDTITLPINGLDNIFIDEVTGDLFIGVHPKLLMVDAHFADPNHAHAPGVVHRVRTAEPHLRHQQVPPTTERQQQAETNPEDALLDELNRLAVEFKDEGRHIEPITSRKRLTATSGIVDEVHYNSGELFSAISTGVWNRPTNELMMGAVAVEGILICPYPNQEELKNINAAKTS